MNHVELSCAGAATGERGKNGCGEMSIQTKIVNISEAAVAVRQRGETVANGVISVGGRGGAVE